MRRLVFSATVFALTVLLATPAWAVKLDISPGAPDQKEISEIFGLTFGIKAGAGVELWTEPSNTKFTYRDAAGTKKTFGIPFFDETRAGYNYSIGAYVEMRFFQYVGLEIGFSAMRHTLLEDTDWSYTLTANGQTRTFESTTEQQLVFTSFHIPIIIKGILPVSERVRLSLGIGPEFTIGSYSFATFEWTGGDALQGERADFRDLGTKTVNDILLAVVFGVDIRAGNFRVPIDIKFAYNFSQPGDYYDRISYNQLPTDGREVHPTTGTFEARDNMYLQLLVGLAYDFF